MSERISEVGCGGHRGGLWRTTGVKSSAETDHVPNSAPAILDDDGAALRSARAYGCGTDRVLTQCLRRAERTDEDLFARLSRPCRLSLPILSAKYWDH